MSTQVPLATMPAVVFYQWPQRLAQRVFTALLEPHLPDSNMFQNRILIPHNTLSRGCLFGATFPPPATVSAFVAPSAAENFTLIFADRARHHESQIWLFNPLVRVPSPLSPSDTVLITAHLHASLRFLKSTPPANPSITFLPTLKFACLHPHLALPLVALASSFSPSAVLRASVWDLNFYMLDLAALAARPRPPPPAGFAFATVPEAQVATVLGTSKIVRQPDTFALLPNAALVVDGGGDDDGKLAAWAYIGVDGAVATLYTMPQHRGKGLGLVVVKECVRRLGAGEFKVPAGGWEDGYEDDEGSLWAYDGSCGWTHADVERGNGPSESVMRRLGAEIRWQSRYVWIDADLID